jgi:hypothetical protein
MVQFHFTREFRHWAERSRKHCVLCKALALIVHKPGVIEIDEETARAATAAGAGAVVETSGGGSCQ